MPRGRKVSPEQGVVMLRQIEVQTGQGKDLSVAWLRKRASPSRATERAPLPAYGGPFA